MPATFWKYCSLCVKNFHEHQPQPNILCSFSCKSREIAATRTQSVLTIARTAVIHVKWDCKKMHTLCFCNKSAALKSASVCSCHSRSCLLHHNNINLFESTARQRQDDEVASISAQH